MTPLPPIVTLFSNKAFETTVKIFDPSPPKAVTSFMDGPLLFYRGVRSINIYGLKFFILLSKIALYLWDRSRSERRSPRLPWCRGWRGYRGQVRIADVRRTRTRRSAWRNGSSCARKKLWNDDNEEPFIF